MSSRVSTSRFPWLQMDSLVRFFMANSHAGEIRTPTIGLALSYGGARGLAHIGVIQVFEEEKIPISALAGSSMGAYIGALWASGVDGKGIAKLAAEIKDRRALLHLLDPIIFPVSGCVRGIKIRRHLRKTLGNLRIEDLQRKMLIVATNLDTAEAEILRDMSVADAVQASCAIPGIFTPVHLNDNRYIDGAASAPLPVRLLKRETKVDHVIGVNVMPTAKDVEICNLDTFPVPPKRPDRLWGRFRFAFSRSVNLFAYGNVLDTFMRCLTSAQRRMVADDATAADVLIHPFVCESKWYDFENFDRYIAAGRDAATAALPRIRDLLKSQSSINTHETVPLISAVGCRSS